MTDDKLADDIERALGERGDWEKRVYATASLAGERWQQIIAALRRSEPVEADVWSGSDKPLLGTPNFAVDKFGRQPSSDKVLREALIFFVAQAFGDGFFDDDETKERVREWLLKPANRLRDDITIEEIVESMLSAAEAEGHHE